ncbi:MAG: SLBB domain-containing protein, partial [Mariprofundaceae bacterium]
IQRTDPVTGELTLLRPPLGQMLSEKYSATNPELRPDDKLMVFSNAAMSQLDSVIVTGSVRHPGEFPLGKGLKVSDLVLAAGGPMENAYLNQAELTRYEVLDGEKRVMHHIQIDLAKALSGDVTADLMLQAHDVVMVRTISNWRAHQQIELKGEFRFPGIYTIEEGESLEQVIERAGGLTEDAFMAAAFFSRESIRDEQQKRLQEYIDRTEREIAQTEAALQSINDPKLLAEKQKGLSAATAVLEKLKKLKPEGRLLIDIDNSGRLKGGSTLKLVDGDVLYAPKRPDEVMVMGEVYNPSAMLYRKNMDRDDFIDLAGGTTAMADDDRIYIVRANGYVDSGSGWSSNTATYPGDTIVVPQKLEVFNLLDTTLDWSKVLMQIGVFTASMVTVGIL